ncbi:MAG: four helix bundle protein [Bacteroidales bacterium]|nr:four helix bundle protein [Deltaproteobacteria bacterium]MBL7139229.1 four helix bundle protein [Bacteroidales bacterium]
MKTHKDLDAWKGSIAMVTEIYKQTICFPKHETYGLTNQIRRAAVSVPANISEGAARINSREFRHYLRISLGSLNELETLLIISLRLDYITQSVFESIFERIILLTAQISGLIKAMDRKIINQQALK